MDEHFYFYSVGGNLNRHIGQLGVFRSQVSMQPEWKLWLQGMLYASEPGKHLLMHIEHSSVNSFSVKSTFCKYCIIDLIAGNDMNSLLARSTKESISALSQSSLKYVFRLIVFLVIVYTKSFRSWNSSYKHDESCPKYSLISSRTLFQSIGAKFA